MKKLLSIVLAAVMVLAMTVAVAADFNYEAPAGYSTFLNTANDKAMTDAADAIGDDAVITFTFDAPADLASYSYFELQLRDAGWAAWPNTPYDNYTLYDVKASGSTTFSITYGELNAIINAESFDVHSMQFISNTDPGDPGPIKVTVSVSGDAAEAEAPVAEPYDPAEETNAPATGLALAVVPAIVAMAAVAVSKKH